MDDVCLSVFLVVLLLCNCLLVCVLCRCAEFAGFRRFVCLAKFVRF